MKREANEEESLMKREAYELYTAASPPSSELWMTPTCMITPNMYSWMLNRCMLGPALTSRFSFTALPVAFSHAMTIIHSSPVS